ncbi:MAG TPA: PASTA domain-containing protein [Chitinophagaceae bacterium]
MFKFLTTRPLWINILAVIVLVLLIILFFFAIIGWLTKHNEYEKVPSVIGMPFTQAEQVLDQKGFKVEIQDSVYVDTAMRLSVIRQSPDPDATVKANRTVYLTINRAVPPLASVPNMVGFSFRSAEMMLESIGLKLGDTTYRPDIAKNSVLEQLYNGKPIAPMTQVPMGSTISFVLGSGLGSAEMNVPNVVGMTLGEAKAYLSSLNINMGAVVPPELAGNDQAYVYQTNPPQYASPSPGVRVQNKIRPGQLLDLYVTVAKPQPATPDTSANTPNP